MDFPSIPARIGPILSFSTRICKYLPEVLKIYAECDMMGKVEAISR